MSYEANTPDQDAQVASGEGGIPWKLIGFIIVVILVVIFVIQNRASAKINYFTFDGNLPMWAVIGLSVVAGIILGQLGGWLLSRRKDD
ncbi:MAG: hypothetical protein CSA55_00170 [Ilumatobacter coccineus]|uniref:Lipopolysaccharide assembly protein A domain-containing protein n=1 Tax=Ilumatobacter coccineus TaxID=467094 RepID=A0A2G6KHF2_9ACTN|nr:MAG: hypothetical protein CSA55_00170 [Ilumatobacter coccineus]